MRNKLRIRLALVLPALLLIGACSSTPEQGDPVAPPSTAGQIPSSSTAEPTDEQIPDSQPPQSPGPETDPSSAVPRPDDQKTEAATKPPGTAAPEPKGPGVKPSQPTPKVGSRRGAPPANAKVPTVRPPLETHPGDKDNFYVDTADYVVWAKRSTHTNADWEYRVVCFGSDGMQSLAFLKYVFADEAEADSWAKTNELLIRVGTTVYYKGWMGPEKQDKAGVIELASAAGNEYYISKP